MALSRRARVGWLALLVLASLFLLVLLAAWWLARLLQPERLTPLLLAEAEKRLGLVLSVERPAEYALRPEPRLRLSGLSARRPGATSPLLTLQRLELSLPWSTLTGEGLVIHRLDLIGPVLDLPAIQDWLAQRPPGEATDQLPTLTEGMRIEDGRVLADGWRLEALNLSLPRLEAGRALTLTASGSLSLAEAAPWPWRLHAQAVPSGMLVLDDLEIDFAGESPLPEFSGSGALRLDGGFALSLSGELHGWRAEWPALPAPIADSASPLPFELDWRGADPMSGELRLTASRDEVRFEGTAQPQRLGEWLEGPESSLLPPLTGLLTAPVLELGGTRLEGVRIELSPDPPAAADGDRP